MLKLDVQGFEMKALNGARSVLAGALAVQLEASLVELYSGEANFESLQRRLIESGFELWDLTPEFRDKETGRLLQVNCLFARPDVAAKTAR
jgi:hypothetical protein